MALALNRCSHETTRIVAAGGGEVLSIMPLARELRAIVAAGQSGRLIDALGRQGYFITSVEGLEAALTHGPYTAALKDTRALALIGRTVEAMMGRSPTHFAHLRPDSIQIERPVLIAGGDHGFARGALKLFDPDLPRVGCVTAVTEGEGWFIPPPDVPLDTQNDYLILQILEYAGLRFLSPSVMAAREAIEVFIQGREMAFASAAPWIGFDWDFTTDIYRIFADVGALVSMKLFHRPPADRRKVVRVVQSPKPGAHELMIGMAVGFARRQGLERFSEWERYRPQVRIVTQTWPERLWRFATIYNHRLIPLLMGRLPGLPLTADDVARSDAVIHARDFMQNAGRLLRRWDERGHDFTRLSRRERDEIMGLFEIGRGHVLKPLSAFDQRGWPRPTLIFDDSPASNERLAAAGVQVVSTVNPIVPGGEMGDARMVTLTGRRAATRQLIRMASQTEAPSFRSVLGKIASGERHVRIDPGDLQPVPDGTLLVVRDGRQTLVDLWQEMERPKREIKLRIRATVRTSGGLRRLRKAYAETRRAGRGSD